MLDRRPGDHLFPCFDSIHASAHMVFVEFDERPLGNSVGTDSTCNQAVQGGVELLLLEDLYLFTVT